MRLNLSELSPVKRYYVLSSLVVPRPIAWVTTLDEDGKINAAPFSYFQLLGQEPPLVVLGIGRRTDGSAKDSFRNIRRSREFVINIVTEENAELMNLCATDFPSGMSEIEQIGLKTEPSVLVKPPRPRNWKAAKSRRCLSATIRSSWANCSSPTSGTSSSTRKACASLPGRCT